MELNKTKTGMLIKLANGKIAKVIACTWLYVQVEVGKKVIEYSYNHKGYYQLIELI